MVSSIEEVTEPTLLSRIRGGDGDALDLLLRRYYQTIFAFAYRITGQVHEAEEVTQETMMKVARSIKSFQGQSKLSTWLYRITINVAHDRRKKEGRQDSAKESLTEIASIHQPSAQINQPQEVLDALATLTTKEREAMVLTVYEEMNHAEAAETLGCAETTISWRIFTAKKKLKKYYQEHGI